MDALDKRDDLSVAENVVAELRRLAEKSKTTYHEKAVNTMIATDMVAMAYEDKYDVAYLLSADGDFTPAVKKVIATGRKVIVASAMHGNEISRASTTFISLSREHFTGCWR